MAGDTNQINVSKVGKDSTENTLELKFFHLSYF